MVTPNRFRNTEPSAPGADRVRYHERRVMRAAHPLVFPIVERLGTKPVRRIPRLGVLVSDTTLMREVLLDQRTYSKVGKGASSDLWTPIMGPTAILNMHGEEHRALRRKLGPVFAPASVNAIVEDGQGPIIRRMRDELDRRGEIDITRIARTSASRMISRIAGIEDAPITDELFQRITELTGLVKLTKPRFGEKEARIAREHLRPITESVERRYRDGDPAHLPGFLRQLGLSADEAQGTIGALVVTGTETLVAHIPRFIAMLIDSGGWDAFARMNGGEREAVVQEGLRVTTPSPMMLRSATERSELGGVSIRPGDRMLLATYLANQQPGSFSLTEDRASAQQQLWFGAGPHFCLGAPLALAQIRGISNALADTGAALRIIRREPARGVLVPGYRTLTVAAANGTSTEERT